MPIPSQLRECRACRRGMNTYLVLGPADRSHLWHLCFVPRKTMRGLSKLAVPVDGGHLGIVLVQEQFCALRVARDGVQWPTDRVDHDGIGDLRAATRNFELDRGSLVVPGGLDQCSIRRHRAMSPASQIPEWYRRLKWPCLRPEARG
jgi:hypothetical protein